MRQMLFWQADNKTKDEELEDITEPLFLLLAGEAAMGQSSRPHSPLFYRSGIVADG